MLHIENKDLFAKIIADALSTVEQTVLDYQTKKRWINAIGKAAAEIENNGTFMTWQADEQSLLIWSQKSNHIYSANGVCQCYSFNHGAPCFHRAAARLVRLYIEAENNPPATVKSQAEEMNQAPFLKPTIERKPEKVGGIIIN